MPSIQKSSKKRAAPASSHIAAPKAKKVHVEKSLDRIADPDEKGKKRSRPVTAPVKENDEEEEEDEDEDIAEDAEDEIDVDSPNLPLRDPNAARESHKAQKELHDQRRAAKPHSVLLANAKRIWSLARQKNIPTTERQKHVRELMDVIRGRVKDIVFKHDASRIVQTVVKYGGQKERDTIAMELKGSYKELAQNKYSKFLVTKLIRLCPTQRASILLEFSSHVMRLLLHREASGMLADAFELYANAYERSILLRDFYGKETALFTVTAGSEEDKERGRKGLKGVLEGVEGERRKRIVSAVKDNLTTIYNNPDKGAVTHAIVHRALWEYMQVVNDAEDETEREKLRREIFESCQDMLAEMVHTKDGSRVVREFIAQGSAKDRKHIIKVLKPHVERMCADDEAQLVLFTALDVIDDTKLTAKSLVASITSTASSLATSPQGRRSLLYLLVPRSRRHFTPAQIASLTETDAARERTSKKLEEARRDEVRAAASGVLVDFVKDKGEEVARDTGGSLVVAEIMLEADGDKKLAMEALLQPLTAPYPSPDTGSPHPIDLPHTSRLYKTLLQGGHFNHATHAITPSTRFDGAEFARLFVRIVGKERTVEMARGDGAFVVAELCTRLKAAEDGDDVRKEVKEWFGPRFVEELEGSDGKGRAVLLEKIKALS